MRQHWAVIFCVQQLVCYPTHVPCVPCRYWGTIGQAGFSDQDAAVVCRELGYTGGSAGVVSLASHGITPAGNNQPVWLSNVDCSGREEALSQCIGGRPGLRKDLGHESDVAVACFYASDHRGKVPVGL